MLGFDKRGDSLCLDPCIPSDWSGFTLEYRFGAALYVIEVRNPARVSRGVLSVVVDGTSAVGGRVSLVDDGKRHAVVVTLGRIT
jgi:cellobiose phosphorylase